jgi:hypothetical protein
VDMASPLRARETMHALDYARGKKHNVVAEKRLEFPAIGCS